MMSIDWAATQQWITDHTPYAPGPVDGIAGRSTYGALLSVAAQRQPDNVMRVIAAAMPKYLNALSPKNPPGSAHKYPEGVPYGINQTRNRLAIFLGCCANETGGWRLFAENLRYSNPRRLMAVYPSRFKTLAQAMPYIWNPSDADREDVTLANLVYGDKGGNQVNGTADNDGWDFRGGGLPQHTFKAEYDALRTRLGITSEEVHAGGDRAVLAACDYWFRAGMNPWADQGNFTAVRSIQAVGHPRKKNPIGLDNVLRITRNVLGVLK